MRAVCLHLAARRALLRNVHNYHVVVTLRGRKAAWSFEMCLSLPQRILENPLQNNLLQRPEKGHTSATVKETRRKFADQFFGGSKDWEEPGRTRHHCLRVFDSNGELRLCDSGTSWERFCRPQERFSKPALDSHLPATG